MGHVTPILDDFATKRSKNFVGYLIGDGLFGRIPRESQSFYELAGVCGEQSWLIKGCKKANNSLSKDGCCETSKNPNCHSLSHPYRGSTNLCQCRTNQSNSALFIPKPILPVPLSRETYRLWKSGMNMGFRFRRLRKHCGKLLLQPIGEFPSFLTNFLVARPRYLDAGLFELLSEFLTAFFTGINVELLSAIDCSKWHVTERVNTITNQNQVYKFEIVVLSS